MKPVGRRRRVLFLAEAVTLAHVARASTLARFLDPARYEVHLAWDPRYNHLLGDLPFPYHPVSSLPTGVFLRRLAAGVPMHDTPTLRAYVDEDLATITSAGADVVVGDFRLSLAASARLAGVPLVAVANAYWSPFARQSFIFPEYEYPLCRLLGDSVARRLFAIFRGVGFAAHTRPLNTVLRANGLPVVGGDIRQMYTCGDYTAYADFPELMPTFGEPRTHRFIGAVLWSPAVAPPVWWQDLPTDRPIIYATPGSSGDAGVLAVVLDALAELPVTVIAATAGLSQVAAPANAYVSDVLPGSEAAARAALVICNGGSPTTYQALAGGVPVLALASNNMDQHLNMQAVCRAGAGVVIRARGVKKATIRAAVEHVLSNCHYREKAKALALAHGAWDAAIRFPALMDELTGQ